MKDKVIAFCQKWLSPGDAVVCALSGGMDSVVLLDLLQSVSNELRLQLSAAHFNHCLRGEESDGDEAFVRALCKERKIPLTVGRGCPDILAKETGQSIEEAARTLRYQFLLQQPGKIVLAHHADDQLETVLLNLLRGTGLRGLGGMEPCRGRLLRPLLEIRRRDLAAYAKEKHLRWREDSTNSADDALRNRLRHQVTPLLYQENPDLAGTVSRMTAILRQEDSWLRSEAAALLQTAACGDGWSCSSLREAAPVLRRRAIRLLLEEVPKPSCSHVDAVERLLLQTDGTASVDLPGGVVACRSYDVLTIAPKSEEGSLPVTPLLPGSTLTVGNFTVSVSEPVLLQEPTDQIQTFALSANCLSGSLTLRSRQTGDLLRLPGGSRSLKRLMIDRKIPAPKRQQIPVLSDEQGVLAAWWLGADRDRTAAPGELAIIINLKERER